MTADEKGAQLERFQETARQLGCDEDEAAFDEKLKMIGRQKHKDGVKPAREDSDSIKP